MDESKVEGKKPQDGGAMSLKVEKSVLAATQKPESSSSGTASRQLASAISSQSRMPYTPQFSAATEMILKRIRGEPTTFNNAVSPASAAGVSQSTYEDAKRRLVMSMNTTLTLPMPATSASPAPAPTPGLYSHSMATSRPPSGSASKPAPPAKGASKRTKAQKGGKRKKVKGEEDSSSSLSELSEIEGDGAFPDPAAPTMTKSGRQVQKPTQFTPAQAAAANKKKHYGKRTPEQALCKVCTRGLSPANNQIVFCDGCNVCWHQLCHDPYIDDEFVSDESRSWFCRGCSAKREKQLAKKKSVDGFKGVSWANKSAEQKRNYLSSLTPGQLVNVTMYALELHPDLPIFPANENGAKRGLAAALAGPGPYLPLARAETSSNRGGPTLFGAAQNNSQSNSEQARREGSEDSIPPSWPKVGHGVLKGLQQKEEDLQDKDDFEAFSEAVYDVTGRKIKENGKMIG
ncbi:hypothetical protein PG991_007682 [Apiospora marii]|uniref:PHD-type domain-containing protein n=1 Tax=Apiospora marii TaxID=335849 RepID=A0ABR1RUC9_9PEZI